MTALIHVNDRFREAGTLSGVSRMGAEPSGMRCTAKVRNAPTAAGSYDRNGDGATLGCRRVRKLPARRALSGL